jgi:hypothetical protein
MEARLGVAESWQSEICDQFALESGCGLVLSEDESDENKPSECQIPVVIHASADDKVVPYEALQWAAKRCYGGLTHLVTHHKLNSHEEMILFGGGLDNPHLLRTIAQDWDLLNLDKDEGRSNDSE